MVDHGGHATNDDRTHPFSDQPRRQHHDPDRQQQRRRGRPGPYSQHDAPPPPPRRRRPPERPRNSEALPRWDASVQRHERTIKSLQDQLQNYRSDDPNSVFQKDRVLECLGRCCSAGRRGGRCTFESHDVSLLLDLIVSIPDADVQMAAQKQIESVGLETTMTKTEAMDFVRNVSANCQLGSNGASASRLYLLKVLAVSVKAQRDHLSAEETAQDVVGGIFLPYLEGDDERGDDRNSAAETTTHSVLCEALQALLISPSHASAMLGPLIQDVGDEVDGNEDQVVVVQNPLRRRLLTVISSNLGMRLDGRRIEEQRNLCDLLAVTLKAMVKIDDPDFQVGRHGDSAWKRPSTRRREDKGLNLIKVQGFLLQVLDDSTINDYTITKKSDPDRIRLYVASLRLLKQLIVRCPNSMTRMGWKLLLETGASSASSSTTAMKKCQFCSTKIPGTMRYLPSVIHLYNGFSTPMDSRKEVVTLVTECLTGLVHILPWKTWLLDGRAPCKSHHSSGRHVPTSGLSGQVVESLIIFVRVLQCTFHRNFLNREEAAILLPQPIEQLIKAVFQEIPFQDDGLNQAGQSLWECLVKDVHHSNGIASDIVVSSMGGMVTPNGDLEGMCRPARSWFLHSASATPFVQELIQSIHSTEKIRVKLSVRVLSAMLRALPDVAFLHWVKFRNLIDHMSTSEKLDDNMISLEMLKAFMMGRRDFILEAKQQEVDEESIMELVILVLGRKMAFDSVKSRQYSLQILSCLNSRDWEWLDCHNGTLDSQFRNMMDTCDSSNAGVREASCKALGEFCTNFLSRCPLDNDAKQKHYKDLCVKVCQTMLGLCRDMNGPVRAFALYALGNLASAIRDSEQTDTLGGSTLQQTSRVVLAAFGDDNIKVAGNAIRSAGHVGFLLGRQADLDESSNALLVDVFMALAEKLADTLAVSVASTKTSSFTWKQRSAAKKHGWGACYSLGQVFQGYPESKHSEAILESTSLAARHLVDCILYRARLNEKVPLAAMAAISQLDQHVLTKINGTTGLIGDALAESIVLFQSLHIEMLSNRSSTAQKLASANDLLLAYLLGFASVSDVCVVLKREEVDARCLGLLYTWMVERPDLGSHSFEIFAVAFQHPSPWTAVADISLEHMFASRASKLQNMVDSEVVYEDENESGDEDEL